MRLADRPVLLVGAAIAIHWLTTLAVGLRADGVELGARELLNVVVLGPLGLVCAFSVARHVAGVALGAWTLFVWVALPWLAPLYTLAPYDATMRDVILPAAVGLTSDLGYVEGIALLAAVALAQLRRREALGGAALLFGVVVAAWLTRLPLPDLSLDALRTNMAGLREYFWSQRALQWLPLAGAIGVARRSPRLALVLSAWLGAYLVLRAARPSIGYADGALFLALLPALPAYVLLASALPLLVPTLAARLGPLARSTGTS